MLRRNGPVIKSVESVLRLEGSVWWERFVKEFSYSRKIRKFYERLKFINSSDTNCRVCDVALTV